MSDFEIESDDDDDSFSGGRGHNNRFDSKKPIVSKQKASKSFFGGESSNHGSNNDDVYNFDFDETDAPKKSYSPDKSSAAPFKKNNDTGLMGNGSKNSVAASSESALEKAKNMLNKYDKVKTSTTSFGAKNNAQSPQKNMFTLKKPNESFDEDDISLDSREDESGNMDSMSMTNSLNNIKRKGSFDEAKPLYGSPLLGSFNKDEDGTYVRVCIDNQIK